LKIARHLARALKRSTTEKETASGSGRPNAQVVFEPGDQVVIFLAYAEEDRVAVKRLFDSLKKEGFDPWMDQEKLLPGENWPRAIEEAIESADFFCVCFSNRSVGKRGYFQSEVRLALDRATYLPFGDIFLVPIRLSECVIPREISKRMQYLDLFPDWEIGITALVSMIRGQVKRRGTCLKER